MTAEQDGSPVPAAPLDPESEPRLLTVILPETRMSLYLAWVDFVRSAEREIRRRLPLARSAEQAGFVCGPAAEEFQALALRPIVKQAKEAARRGMDMMAPELTARSDRLCAVADYIERWGAWLVTERVLERATIPMPGPEVAVLRRRVIRAIRAGAR